MAGMALVIDGRCVRRIRSRSDRLGDGGTVRDVCDEDEDDVLRPVKAPSPPPVGRRSRSGLRGRPEDSCGVLSLSMNLSMRKVWPPLLLLPAAEEEQSGREEKTSMARSGLV